MREVEVAGERMKERLLGGLREAGAVGDVVKEKVKELPLVTQCHQLYSLTTLLTH
jgi:hypothetical protein